MSFSQGTPDSDLSEFSLLNPPITVVWVILGDSLVVLQVGLKPLTATELFDKDAHFVAVTELGDTVANHVVPPVLEPAQMSVARILKIHEGT